MSATRAEKKTDEAAPRKSVPERRLCLGSSARLDPGLAAQDRFGNAALGRLLRTGVIRPKLAVSQPGDLHEREADRIADQLVAPLSPQASSADVHASPPLVQRACSSCATAAPCAECAGREDQIVHRHADGGAGSGRGTHGGRDVDSVVSSLGPARPLDPGVRAAFEPRLGRDLGDVRIHTSAEGAAAAHALHAEAFTIGNDVAFAAGKYGPNTPEGQHLIAHELVHVVQQGSARETVRRQPDAPQPAAAPTAVTPESAAALDDNGLNLAAFNIAQQLQTTTKGTPEEETLRGSLAVVRAEQTKRCNQANADPKSEAKPADLLMRTVGGNVFAIRVSAVLQSQKSGAGPMSTSSNSAGAAKPVLASMTDPVSCAGLDRSVIESYFQALGAGPGETILVRPDDPLHVLAGTALMRQENVPLETAKAIVSLTLRPDPPVNADDPANAKPDAQPPGPGGGGPSANPLGLAAAAQPPQLAQGNECHSLIAEAYRGVNAPPIFTNSSSLIDIIQSVGMLFDAVHSPNIMLLPMRRRPDILDYPKRQIYEIKSTTDAADAIPQALEYIAALEMLGVPELKMTLGNPGNPGTEGILPSVKLSGACVYACPLPGAILYQFVRPPQNPGYVRERIRNGAYGPTTSLASQLGPEAVVALAFGTMGAAVVGVEVASAIATTVASAATYEALLALLARGAQLAAGTILPAATAGVPALAK